MMFNDEERAILTEMVADRIELYQKQVREAQWARLSTTEEYLTARLDRLRTIVDKLSQTTADENAPASGLAQSGSRG